MKLLVEPTSPTPPAPKINREHYIRQCAKVVTALYFGCALKSDAILSVTKLCEAEELIIPGPLTLEVIPGRLTFEAKAIVTLSASAAAVRYVHETCWIPSPDLDHVLRLANRASPRNRDDIFCHWYTQAQRMIQTDRIAWPLLILLQRLERDLIMIGDDVEDVLAPFLKYWRGEGPDPVGALSVQNLNNPSTE